MEIMWRRLIVTLAALAQIGAGALPANPHTVTIHISDTVPLGNAHVFLGVAVLGHHVGRLEAGWLVKQAQPGILHIDWTKSGNWDGLTRDVEGPRDVSQAQLDAVVHTIEGFGFASSAIRAWRVPAPVGYDGFNEGDKVLMIGEILVDLGPLGTARDALDHLWPVVGKDDPFEKIPRTNVRYAAEFFLQPDCSALDASERGTAVAKANALAASIARTQGTTATFASYELSSPSQLLCPQGREPHFYLASGATPFRLNDYAFEQPEINTITYTLAGLSAQPAMQTLPNDLPAETTQYAFSLPEPYVATVGTADCTTTLHDALSSALSDSRRRADALANLLHARVTRLGAARISGPSIDGKDCEKTTVDAAWLLEGVALPNHALVSASYSGQVQGPPSDGTIGLQALLMAAREALVDNPHIVTMYETEPLTLSWTSTHVTETLIVQR